MLFEKIYIVILKGYNNFITNILIGCGHSHQPIKTNSRISSVINMDYNINFTVVEVTGDSHTKIFTNIIIRCPETLLLTTDNSRFLYLGYLEKWSGNIENIYQ